MVTRTPSSPYCRTMSPAASHASANAVESDPSGNHTKFASESGSFQPWSWSARTTRSRSATIDSTRSFSSSKASSEATAATWASELTPNGVAVLRIAAATSGCATAKPTRSPARPYALEKVRRTTTLGRSRQTSRPRTASGSRTNST